MSLGISKDKGQVHSKGGGIIKIQEILETGSDLSPRSAVDDLGYVNESTFSDKTPLDDVKDETGNTVTQEEGDRTVSVTSSLMQTDKKRIDMAEGVRGRFYRMYKYNGIVDGFHQEMFFAVGKVTPQVELKFTGGRIPFEYKADVVASDTTCDGTTFTLFGAHAIGGVVIPAGKYYTVIETAVTP